MESRIKYDASHSQSREPPALDALRIDASPHKSCARVNHDKIFGCKMGKLRFRMPRLSATTEKRSGQGTLEYGIASGWSISKLLDIVRK